MRRHFTDISFRLFIAEFFPCSYFFSYDGLFFRGIVQIFQKFFCLLPEIFIKFFFVLFKGFDTFHHLLIIVRHICFLKMHFFKIMIDCFHIVFFRLHICIPVTTEIFNKIVSLYLQNCGMICCIFRHLFFKYHLVLPVIAKIIGITNPFFML